MKKLLIGVALLLVLWAIVRIGVPSISHRLNAANEKIEALEDFSY